jgi:hypothetical protein
MQIVLCSKIVYLHILGARKKPISEHSGSNEQKRLKTTGTGNISVKASEIEVFAIEMFTIKHFRNVAMETL